MRVAILVFAGLFATAAAAQAPADGPVCRGEGFGRDVSTKMTDTLLDMGFVGFERMTIVEGCYRVVAKNSAGNLVVLTFDQAGELIGLGLGTGGAAPRFAPARDGVRETD